LDERINRVKALYERYEQAMPDLPFLKFLPVDIGAGGVPVYVEVLCKDRDRLIDFLEDQGIQSRPFYPDLNLAEYFHNDGGFPNSVRYGMDGLILPSGPDQPLENVDRVVEVLKAYADHFGAENYSS